MVESKGPFENMDFNWNKEGRTTQFSSSTSRVQWLPAPSYQWHLLRQPHLHVGTCFLKPLRAKTILVNVSNIEFRTREELFYSGQAKFLIFCHQIN
jgi:hypothetical protein